MSKSCQEIHLLDVKLELQLGKRLRVLRKESGLTQERLAELAGLEYKYIQMLEGKTPPSATLRTLTKLSKALDLAPWELIMPQNTRRRVCGEL